jgi:hypothetical protein
MRKNIKRKRKLKLIKANQDVPPQKNHIFLTALGFMKKNNLSLRYRYIRMPSFLSKPAGNHF